MHRDEKRFCFGTATSIQKWQKSTTIPPLSSSNLNENDRNIISIACRVNSNSLSCYLFMKGTLFLIISFNLRLDFFSSYVYDREKTLSDKLRFDAVSTLRQGQGSYVNLMVALCK